MTLLVHAPEPGELIEVTRGVELALGPEHELAVADAACEAPVRSDEAVGALLDAAGGPEEFLERYAVVLCSDHGQTGVDSHVRLQTPFADVSGLLRRPWQAYNALVAAYQYGVIEKLLFGSDFPYTNATDCIEAMYSLNQVAQGTNLPVVPREALRGIVERESLALLGLS